MLPLRLVPFGLFHDSSLWFSMLSCMLRDVSGWRVMDACFNFDGVSILSIILLFFPFLFKSIYVHITLSFFIFFVFFGFLFFFFFWGGGGGGGGV
jgi:hypothetical protein